MHNKRDYQRFSAFSEILSCSISDKRDVNVNVCDISCSGIGIQSNVKLKKGDMVGLEVKVPGDDIPMFLTGEVSWAVSDKTNKDTCRAGIRIIRIERNDKSRLIKFLSNGFSHL